jgi:hypothetical protein
VGEYADMMLDGTCCMQCGDYLGGDDGYPVMCPSCRHDEKHEPRAGKFDRYSIKTSKLQKPGDALIVHGKMPCPFCVKRVKVAGMGDHLMTVHRDKIAVRPVPSEQGCGS